MDPGNIRVGQKLHAFAQDKFTNLRSVRGGRQALTRFAAKYPTTGDVEIPPEWTRDPKAANKILERWLKIPENPFKPPEEGESETQVQENERHHIQNRSGTPDEPGAPEQGEGINIGPLSLRNRKKHDQEIAELKEGLKLALAHITTLTTKVSALTTQVATLTVQNEEIKALNEETKAQFEEIREQYTILNSTLTTIATRTTERPYTPTWAGIAAQGHHHTQTRQEISVEPFTQRQNQTRTPGIDVDLSGITNTHFDKSSAKAIREWTRQAFDNHPMTKEIKWVGIEIKGIEQSKIRICMRSQKDVDTARIHNEWLQSHFQGGRIVGDQWYPVKVDKVNISSICKDSSMQLKDDVCTNVGVENGINVKKIRFLRKPSADKAYCSIVMFLANKDEAERVLEEKCINVDGEVAYTKVFVNIPTPKSCFNCHALDKHEARRCPVREPVCGTCACTGHTDKECTASEARCVNCGGPHKASDRGCPEYKRRLEVLQRTNHA